MATGIVVQTKTVFHRVITNEGGAYDNSTGVFTTPVKGTYNFQTTILTYTNSEIWAYFDVNEV